MFITNQLTPAEMLSELLSLTDCKSADTQRFRRLSHDADLCPAFRDRVAAMLTAYKAHRTDVQDVQGPRDEGVDVDLRYELDGPHRAGLQIKSFKEIDDWATKRKPGFVQTLKAQTAAALLSLGCDDYHILLCTDEIAHKKQIRTICSEMKAMTQVRIVLPRHALALYKRSDEAVSILVTQILCEHDAVLDTAIREVKQMAPDHAFVQLALLCRACEGQTAITQEELLEIYDDWLESSASNGSIDGVADLLWDLDGNGFCYSVTGDDDKLAISDFSTPWLALYFDQLQRVGGDVRRRLSLLLGIVPPSFG